MTNSGKPAAKPRWISTRFSIAGLFVLILGIAAGLAYRRSEFYPDWPEVLLFCFLIWFTIGMLQRISQGIRRYRAATAARREVRFGQAIEFLCPLFALAFVTTGIVLELTRHWDWRGDRTIGWGSEEISKVFLALAVICGHALPTQWIVVPAVSGSRTCFWIFEGLGLTVGLLWMLWVLFDLTLLPAFTHIVGQNIRVGFAHYMHGHRDPMPEVPPDLLHHFLIGSVWATALALVGGVLLASVGRWWHRNHRLRLGLSASWLACVVAIGFLLTWCKWIALPVLSPFFEGLYFNDSWLTVVLATALVLSASVMLAVRLTLRWEVDPATEDRIAPAPARRLMHERLDVLLIPLVAAMWIFVYAVQYESLPPSSWRVIATHLAEEFLNPLTQIAMLGALVAIVLQTWRRIWPCSGQPAIPTIDPLQLSIVAAMSLVTCAIIPPALAWFGVGLLFW